MINLKASCIWIHMLWKYEFQKVILSGCPSELKMAET